MTDTFTLDTDIALIGCGRLGSALVEGWLATPGFKADRLKIIEQYETPATDQAKAAGATINPSPEQMKGVGILVLAIKPAVWREALQPFADVIPEDAVVASVMAGVRPKQGFMAGDLLVEYDAENEVVTIHREAGEGRYTSQHFDQGRVCVNLDPKGKFGSVEVYLEPPFAKRRKR